MLLALAPLVAPAAASTTVADTFDADASDWRGGVVTDGVLRVTDGDAVLPLPSATSARGTVRLRLASGARIAVSLGDATWTADYNRDGALTLASPDADSEPLPMPSGHYVWEPDADPVIEPGPQYWDAGDALHAEVLFDDATATWFLYWTGAHPREYYGYRQIGVATSTDGATWTRYEGNPVISIDYDRTTVDGIHAHMPTVVKHGGDWHMFYACYQNDVGNRICHATSDDGLTWEKQGVALDLGDVDAFDFSVRQPDVLVGPDGTWHMLYNGTSPEGHYGATGYATSPDGWTWTRVGQASDDLYRLQGGGMFEGPYGLEQWWNCDDVFCHSVGDWSDLRAWTDTADPVLRKGWAWWNDGYIQAPTPWLSGTTWHMWFNGYTYTDTFERIGHARSVPAAGAWLDLNVEWDGATLRVTQSGATREVPLSAASELRIAAEGVAELDSVALTWEVAPDRDDSGDSGSGATGSDDTAAVDTGADDTDAPVGDDDAGCGCATTGSGSAGAWLAASVALTVARRRRRSA